MRISLQKTWFLLKKWRFFNICINKFCVTNWNLSLVQMVQLTITWYLKIGLHNNISPHSTRDWFYRFRARIGTSWPVLTLVGPWRIAKKSQSCSFILFLHSLIPEFFRGWNFLRIYCRFNQGSRLSDYLYIFVLVITRTSSRSRFLLNSWKSWFGFLADSWRTWARVLFDSWGTGAGFLRDNWRTGSRFIQNSWGSRSCFY